MLEVGPNLASREQQGREQQGGGKGDVGDAHHARRTLERAADRARVLVHERLYLLDTAFADGVPAQRANHRTAAEDLRLAEDHQRAQHDLLVIRRAAHEAADQAHGRRQHVLAHDLVQRIQRRGVFYFDAGDEQAAAFASRQALIEEQRDQRIDHLAQQIDKLGAAGRAGVERRLHPRGDRRDRLRGLFADMGDGGAVQAFLAAEIVLDRRQVDARVFRDRARAGAVETFGGEQRECGFQDAAAGILAALSAPGRYRLAGMGMVSSWGGAHLYLSVDIVNQLIQFVPTIRLPGKARCREWGGVRSADVSGSRLPIWRARRNCETVAPCSTICSAHCRPFLS